MDELRMKAHKAAQRLVKELERINAKYPAAQLDEEGQKYLEEYKDDFPWPEPKDFLSDFEELYYQYMLSHKEH